MFTHTGAGSESAGRFLTLMMGVSAPAPRRLICRSEVKQCWTLVKTQQEIMHSWHFNKDLWISVPPLSDVPSDVDGNCVFSLLMRKDDACWVLGHQEWMTEMGKHFCRLKFCGWKTTYFGLSMMWKDKPNMTGYTHKISRISYPSGAFALTSIYSDLQGPRYFALDFQVFPLKSPKNGFPSSKNNTHTHTCKTQQDTATGSPHKCPALML